MLTLLWCLSLLDNLSNPNGIQWGRGPLPLWIVDLKFTMQNPELRMGSTPNPIGYQNIRFVNFSLYYLVIEMLKFEKMKKETTNLSSFIFLIIISSNGK